MSDVVNSPVDPVVVTSIDTSAEVGTNQPTMPDVADVNKLYASFNDALQTFALASTEKNVNQQMIFLTALSLMFSYPHSWMTSAGTVDHFVDMISTEAKNYVAMVELGKQQAAASAT